MSRIAILTRPQGRNDTLARALARQGWQVLELPALEIQPLPAPPGGVPLPQHYDLVVFVSGNAARLYMAQLQSAPGALASWPSGTVAATVGPASAQALRDLPGFGADTTVLCPSADAPSHDSEALWALLCERGDTPRRALLVRGTQGRDWLANRLEQAGAEVQRHAVYRRQPAPWPSEAVQRLRTWAQQGRQPVWLLTSGEGIAAVQAQLQRHGLQQWWHAARYIVTHPSLAGRLPQAAGGDAAAPMVQICLPVDEAILAAFVAA